MLHELQFKHCSFLQEFYCKINNNFNVILVEILLYYLAIKLKMKFKSQDRMYKNTSVPIKTMRMESLILLQINFTLYHHWEKKGEQILIKHSDGIDFS